MANMQKLKGKIVERNFTRERLAEQANIGFSTLNKKINTGKGWTIEEVGKLVSMLDLSSDEAVEIFLP